MTSTGSRITAAGLLGMAFLALIACGNERSAKHEPAAEPHDGHSVAARVGHPHHEGEHGRADRDGPVGQLRIDTEVQKRFGIVTAPAAPEPVEVFLDLPGEIVPDPERMVHVKPPFAGTIRRVAKHIGDTVEAGDVLAVLESAQALAPYTIRAGIAGTITTEHAAVGESIDRSHELFTIGDTSVVWVQLQVFPSHLARVDVGDPVEVLPPNAESGARGEISFITPMLDHATRTATARVILSNDGTYQPGLFVTGRVVIDHKDAPVSVPTSALIREGRTWIVFVREGEDTFSERAVQVGRRGLERSEIRAGLEAGEEVVANGGFLVKSAAARGGMGGGHSH